MGTSHSSSVIQTPSKRSFVQEKKITSTKSFNSSDKSTTSTVGHTRSVINKETVRETQLAIRNKAFQEEDRSARSIPIQVREAFLDETFIGKTLVNFKIQAGLPMSNEKTKQKEQEKLLVLQVVQISMNEAILPVFLQYFSSRVNKAVKDASGASQNGRFRQKLNDLQTVSVKVFVQMLNILSIQIDDNDVWTTVNSSIFSDNSLASNHILHDLLKVYISDYKDVETKLKDIPTSSMEETKQLESLERTLKTENKFSIFNDETKRIVSSIIRNGSTTKKINDLVYLADNFSKILAKINKPKIGADERMFLNINFLSLFNHSGLFTILQFVNDNLEYHINRNLYHFLFCLSLAYNYIIEQQDKSRNQNKLQTIIAYEEENPLNQIIPVETSPTIIALHDQNMQLNSQSSTQPSDSSDNSR